MKSKLLLILIFLSYFTLAQNVIIVVIDGARYTETFGSDGKYIPHMYNDLAPNGTIFTNFRIADEGNTTTNPGQASILTGTWQLIANDGSEHPNKPTVFEYYRKQLSVEKNDCFIVAGKKKLAALAYSSFKNYGPEYGAATGCFDGNDDVVYDTLITIMDKYHPKLMLINFPSTDKAGHSNVWDDYVKAITNADRLVNQLWDKIQRDPNYANQTTLFVTNDHGRHTDSFTNHGCDCEGCEHIMLLAIGKEVPKGEKISELYQQIDIANTVGNLLGFETPYAEGQILFTSDSSK